MDFLITFIIFCIWIGGILTSIFLVPQEYFNGVFLFELSIALQTFVYQAPLFHHFITFIFASILTLIFAFFGFVFFFKTRWENITIAPLYIIFNSVLISTIIVLFPAYIMATVTALAWMAGIGVYVLLTFTFLENIDTPIKDMIFFNLIGIAIQVVGYVSPLIFEIQIPFLSWNFYYGWNFNFEQGLYYLQLFHHPIFYGISWLIIYGLAWWSFIKKDQKKYEEFKKYNLIILVGVSNCFLISLLVIWVPNMVGIAAIMPILVAIDVILVLKLKDILFS